MRGSLIAWKSETGLSNKGRVTFSENNDGSTKVTLSIYFDVPSIVASVAQNDVIMRFVHDTLAADLKRFRTVALLKHRKQIATDEHASSDSAAESVLSSRQESDF